MILCSPKFLFSIQRVCTLPLSFNFLLISLFVPDAWSKFHGSQEGGGEETPPRLEGSSDFWDMWYIWLEKDHVSWWVQLSSEILLNPNHWWSHYSNLNTFFFPFLFFSFSYGNRYVEFSSGDCRSVSFFLFLSEHFVDININLFNKGPEAGGHSKVRCLRVLALIIQ